MKIKTKRLLTFLIRGILVLVFVPPFILCYSSQKLFDFLESCCKDMVEILERQTDRIIDRLNNWAEVV